MPVVLWAAYCTSGHELTPARGDAIGDIWNEKIQWFFQGGAGGINYNYKRQRQQNRPYNLLIEQIQ